MCKLGLAAIYLNWSQYAFRFSWSLSCLLQLSKFLDTTGGSLNYRRYAEVLFDILFAGGMLGKYRNNVIMTFSLVWLLMYSPHDVDLRSTMSRRRVCVFWSFRPAKVSSCICLRNIGLSSPSSPVLFLRHVCDTLLVNGVYSFVVSLRALCSLVN